MKHGYQKGVVVKFCEHCKIKKKGTISYHFYDSMLQM